jgi:hypothetical protein
MCDIFIMKRNKPTFIHRAVAAFLFFLLVFSIQCWASGGNSRFIFDYDNETGGIQRIANSSDPSNMNFVLRSDGSQYSWQTKDEAWGLGFATISYSGSMRTVRWNKVSRLVKTRDETVFEYDITPLRLRIIRRYTPSGDFEEHYEFSNASTQKLSVTHVGIYTPFNDNYPDAKTSVTSRCQAHIWTGENTSYVNAVRMGGTAPHLGLVLTNGSLESYEIQNKTESSAFRGTIILNVEDFALPPGAEYDLSWTLFWHTGWNGFYQQAMRKYGFVKASANSYVSEVGQEVTARFASAAPFHEVGCSVNGQSAECHQHGTEITMHYTPHEPGDLNFQLLYGKNQRTFLRTHVVSSKSGLIQKRVDFIVHKQQNKEKNDPRFGAYMVYDNELNRIYLNDGPRASDDTDEGAERLGMGVLVALYLQQHPNPEYRQSLLDYANFVRTGLQTADYKVYSTVGHKTRHRGYNYPWVAHLYLEMFHLTHEQKYLRDYYATLKRFYREFGHDYYALDIPVADGLHALAMAGMLEERDSLLADFKQMADIFLKNGAAYPVQAESFYDQSALAPVVIFLSEMYTVTKDARYLRGAERLLPMLAAFAGLQPDYHLNEIAVRHWDGYWFGKRRFGGDVFPHHWTALSGVAYWRYAQASGNQEYLRLTNTILENNLAQFFEDGRASCAYIYPARINGQKAQFYDPFANDQDWALAFYLLVHQSQKPTGQ